MDIFNKIFKVKKVFSNPKEYNYTIGEELKLESIKRCEYSKKLLYTFIPADEFTDPFTIEYKTVILDEEEINLLLTST